MLGYGKLSLHHAIVAEAGNALIGYETERRQRHCSSPRFRRRMTRTKRQVNAGGLLCGGVPGVGKTFMA
jgi:hypothetical protein